MKLMDIPNNKEVRGRGPVREERRTIEVIGHSRDCLPGMYVSMTHERRIIRRVENTKLAYFATWYIFVLVIPLAIVVDEYTPHAEIAEYRRMLLGVLQENERSIVA